MQAETDKKKIFVKCKEIFFKLNRICERLDCAPLWWLGFLLMAAAFAPYAVLKTGSVFPIHDQLDESILNYVLTARHFADKSSILPELLGGINASGMQPSAFLFIPLYAVLPPLYAFLTEYAIIFCAAFMGMYLLVKKITDSSVLAIVCGSCFAMLPFYVVYGLSQAGIPLLLYAFLCLYKEEHTNPAFFLIVLFGLSSHLVYTGYIVLGFWALALLVMIVRKKKNLYVWGGFWLLMTLYLVSNHALFAEILFGTGEYVSHRTEMVNAAMPFGSAVWEIFTCSTYHAPSLHKFLIVPILVLLVGGGIAFRHLESRERRIYFSALTGFVVLLLIAAFYGVCKSQPVVDFKNRQSGFLHYFQIDRFYWLYPAGWYLEFALCFSLWWGRGAQTSGGGDAPKVHGAGRLLYSRILQLAALFLVLLPTLQEIKVNSYFYMNVNQINNGSGITGYISWESYYAEDLMKELEEAIGRDMSTYRVAHLGISPAPALMHGFYTVDGYSNNYPLEYKHRFRKVIEKELEKAPETAVYFDTWGSRCYLFNAATGNAWMLGKDTDIVYENPEFDMDALKELDCEYLFSCGEILNAEELGLELLGYFETETGYWGVWLYRL